MKSSAVPTTTNSNSMSDSFSRKRVRVAVVDRTKTSILNPNERNPKSPKFVALPLAISSISGLVWYKKKKGSLDMELEDILNSVVHEYSLKEFDKEEEDDDDEVKNSLELESTQRFRSMKLKKSLVIETTTDIENEDHEDKKKEEEGEVTDMEGSTNEASEDDSNKEEEDCFESTTSSIKYKADLGIDNNDWVKRTMSNIERRELSGEEYVIGSGNYLASLESYYQRSLEENQVSKQDEDQNQSNDVNEYLVESIEEEELSLKREVEEEKDHVLLKEDGDKDDSKISSADLSLSSLSVPNKEEETSIEGYMNSYQTYLDTLSKPLESINTSNIGKVTSITYLDTLSMVLQDELEMIANSTQGIIGNDSIMDSTPVVITDYSNEVVDNEKKDDGEVIRNTTEEILSNTDENELPDAFAMLGFSFNENLNESSTKPNTTSSVVEDVIDISNQTNQFVLEDENGSLPRPLFEEFLNYTDSTDNDNSNEDPLDAVPFLDFKFQNSNNNKTVTMKQSDANVMQNIVDVNGMEIEDAIQMAQKYIEQDD